MDIVVILDKSKSLSDQLDELIKQDKKGYHRALEETAKYIFNHYLTMLSKTTREKPDTLKKVLKVTLRPSSNHSSMHIWVGANSIPYHYFGTPNQSGSNVVIGAPMGGAYIIQNAFVTKINGREMVFKRVGRSPLPIKLQKKDVEPELKPYITSTSTEFMNYFLRSLKRHVFKNAH